MLIINEISRATSPQGADGVAGAIKGSFKTIGALEVSNRSHVDIRPKRQRVSIHRSSEGK